MAGKAMRLKDGGWGQRIRGAELTEFRKRVYLALLEIPRGRVETYGGLARRIGCRSPRAVGQALRANPFAPDVPCHRVIAADGSLGGYNGDVTGREIARKRRLLEAEGVRFGPDGKVDAACIMPPEELPLAPLVDDERNSVDDVR